MSQVPVKWAYTNDLYLEDSKRTPRIPVVPLSALREVVEELRDGYTGDSWAYKWALNDLLALLGEGT